MSIYKHSTVPVDPAGCAVADPNSPPLACPNGEDVDCVAPKGDCIAPAVGCAIVVPPKPPKIPPPVTGCTAVACVAPNPPKPPVVVAAPNAGLAAVDPKMPPLTGAVVA